MRQGVSQGGDKRSSLLHSLRGKALRHGVVTSMGWGDTA
jgi:hypothetical protein